MSNERILKHIWVAAVALIFVMTFFFAATWAGLGDMKHDIYDRCGEVKTK